jgi:hypothetical protein
MLTTFAAVLVLAGCASAPGAGQPAGHGAASHAAKPQGGTHQGGHCAMHADRAELAGPSAASSAAPSAEGHASMKHCGHMKAHGQAAQP